MSQQRFRVLHTQVGPYKEGHVFDLAELEAVAPGLDLQRLLDLKAIAPLADSDTAKTEPAPVGPENPTKPPGKARTAAPATVDPDADKPDGLDAKPVKPPAAYAAHGKGDDGGERGRK